MKLTPRAFVFFLCIFIPFTLSCDDKPRASTAFANQTARLHVTGMTCSHCENSLITCLKQIDGVRDAEASHKKEEVQVWYDDRKVDLARIKNAIVRSGYGTP